MKATKHKTYTVEEMHILIESQEDKIKAIELKVDKLLDSHCEERKLLALLKSTLVEYYRSQKSDNWIEGI